MADALQHGIGAPAVGRSVDGGLEGCEREGRRAVFLGEEEAGRVEVGREYLGEEVGRAGDGAQADLEVSPETKVKTSSRMRLCENTKFHAAPTHRSTTNHHAHPFPSRVPTGQQPVRRPRLHPLVREPSRIHRGGEPGGKDIRHEQHHLWREVACVREPDEGRAGERETEVFCLTAVDPGAAVGFRMGAAGGVASEAVEAASCSVSEVSASDRSEPGESAEWIQ